MKVYKCKNCGFCFGVKRAIDTALNLKESGNYILGEIIHNDNVNNKLKESGLITIDSIYDERLKEGDTLLIRTHGEPKSTFIEAEKRKLKVIDCTCPFVNEIHKIVEKHYLDGYKIVIVGNENHPEIKGINGWCENTAKVITSSEELNEVVAEKLCIVVQTTYSEKKFDEIIKNFNRSNVKTVDIFKTICYTTTERQKEAEKLSKICESILVVGGTNSNNTDKLYEICKEGCKEVYRLVNPSDFDYEKIKKYNKVGIVFGASTPIEQFQEVIHNMENVTEEIITTETVKCEDSNKKAKAKAEKVVKSEMEAAFDNIRPSKDYRIGQVVSAKISSANEGGLTLSLKNAKKDFELPKEEMLNEYNKDEYKDKIGEEIRVMVIAKNPVRFSEKAMQKVLAEEANIEEIRNGKIFECEIKSTNKGGLVGKFGSYDVFVPASQVKLGFVKDLEKFVGKTVRLKAEKVESHGSRRQIVGSQRVILLAEKEERDAIKLAKEQEFFDAIQEGDIVLGTPVRFAAFGAFIDVNGFDCLAHISDLSWTGCKECSEVLEIGKTYEFKILKIDLENKRVSVGYKQLQPKPWDSVAEKYHVGDVIKGNVVRIVSFGAFVEVEKGIDGLIHVSQISNKWLENPVSALKVGQEVEAKILEINTEKEKMTLSIKALLPEEEKPAKESKNEKVEIEEELHEWKDADSSSVSIAEMLNK